MPTPSIQTLRADAQQVLNLDSISAVRSVVAATLANANAGTPLNPNLTTQQLWNEFYQIVTQPKSDIESIIANQLMKFLFAPPAPGGAGADKQVIFNDGGVLAGDPQFLWNKTTNLLTVTGSATITGAATVGTTLDVTGQLSTANVVKATGNPGLSSAGATEAFVAHNTTYGAVLYGQGTTYDAALLDRNTGLRLTVTTAGAQVGGDLSMTSGNVVMATSGKGIDFSATPSGSGTMTSELLNDYEEGTWVGTLKGSVSDPTTPVTATGRYTKIGRAVTVQIAYVSVDTTGASGDVSVDGLPFTVGGLPVTSSAGTGDILNYSGTLTSAVNAGGTTIYLVSQISANYATLATHKAGNLKNMQITLTYTV